MDYLKKLSFLFLFVAMTAFLSSCKGSEGGLAEPVIPGGGTTLPTDTTNTGTQSSSSNYKTIVIPANKSYIVPFNENAMNYNPYADKDEVTGWTSLKYDLVWYLHFTPGTYITQINMKIARNDSSNFKLIVTSPNDKSFKQVSSAVINGTGQFGVTTFDTLTISKTSFYRFALHPVAKSGAEVATIKDIRFKTKEAFTKKYGKPRYAQFLSSPSVHLSFKPADLEDRNYNWMYGVIKVPKGFDPVPTFYMAIGFHRGYFGMQVNSKTERRILFSIWDYGNADHEKNIPPENRVTPVDHGKKVIVTRFGNEGAGKHAFWKYDWTTGEPVKFLVNIRLHKKDNSAYISAWFNDTADGKGWRYMATFRAPKYTNYFDGFYSFVEDFGGYVNGQKVRKAYFYNMWGKEVNGGWINFNRAVFSYTDGQPDSRSDYAGGVSPNNPHRFFMRTGGYTHPNAQHISVVPKDHTPPKINLKKLSKRVDAAIAEHGGTIYPRDNWKIIGFDSQEMTHDELAKYVLDGIFDTYWHSQWSTGDPPGFPHWLAIDMGKELTVHGFYFVQRQDGRRNIKDLTIKISDDGKNWQSLGDFQLDHTTLPQRVSLKKAKKFRYFKLITHSAWDGSKSSALAEVGAY